MQDTFQSFAYFSSYFQLKSFAWKRDYTTSLKLQTPRSSPSSFGKSITKLFKVKEHLRP